MPPAVLQRLVLANSRQWQAPSMAAIEEQVPPRYLYRKGVPDDKFTLMLEGRVLVTIGQVCIHPLLIAQSITHCAAERADVRDGPVLPLRPRGAREDAPAPARHRVGLRQVSALSLFLLAIVTPSSRPAASWRRSTMHYT